MQLHQKYAEKGLVCVSLNVEMAEWREEKKAVEDFLKKQNATFANLIFKDTSNRVGDWMDKHEAHATPRYLAFDRTGQQVALPYPQKPDAIEKRLVELLQE